MRIGFDRGKIRTLLICVGCFIGTPTWWTFIAGTTIVGIGATLHLWSKGCLQQNLRLTTTGPYRWTRNPFYLANLLIDIGLCLVISRWWVPVVYFPLWWIVYRRTILREEGRLTRLFGKAYEEYAARVPRLLPKLIPIPKVEDGSEFSWTNPNLASGREYARVVAQLTTPGVIWAVRQIRMEGLGVLTDCYSLKWFLIVLVASLSFIRLPLIRAFKDHRPFLPPICSRPQLQIVLVCLMALLLFRCDVLETEFDLMVFPIGVSLAMLDLLWLAVGELSAISSRYAWLAGTFFVAGWLFELPWVGLLCGLWFATVALDALTAEKYGVADHDLRTYARCFRKPVLVGCFLVLCIGAGFKELMERALRSVA